MIHATVKIDNLQILNKTGKCQKNIYVLTSISLQIEVPVGNCFGSMFAADIVNVNANSTKLHQGLPILEIKLETTWGLKT
jgi:hypothetical protein